VTNFKARAARKILAGAMIVMASVFRAPGNSQGPGGATGLP
jgi:hypothetical protein